jgi:hypothetical protein
MNMKGVKRNGGDARDERAAKRQRVKANKLKEIQIAEQAKDLLPEVKGFNLKREVGSDSETDPNTQYEVKDDDKSTDDEYNGFDPQEHISTPKQPIIKDCTCNTGSLIKELERANGFV